MKDLFFFDGGCSIGGYNGPGIPELLADMDRFGVDRALVWDAWMKISGSVYGNAHLAEALKKEDSSGRLTGVWSILPEACGEIPPPERFFEEMRSARIGALTLFPKENLWTPCRLSIGTMLDAAAKRKIPVLLDGFLNDWKGLYDFLSEFPENIFLYTADACKWGKDRQFRPLMDHYRNLYIGISGYWIPEGIRDLAERYGAERILYTSGFPGYNQGSSMLQLKQSGLNPESVAKIAGGNLEKLLEEAVI